ncbi:hypothetical protein QA646_24485 (plasmid) [Rhizobium sp. CB3090]|uniref:hypothetical protein n=1 Tax=Rhizobium sp. CB3090 TaxID=3039156 RepID=UPI0024B1AF46|nr:hypothetical protein [Rhizobium sp. CB3090]WFU11551.1 hypothetical protein QA646_24485 [Rhizobium sp. CB3090]
MSVQRVEERATGQFLKVLRPTGVVLAISGWMIDPVVCSGMTMGTARVDLAALIELNRLVSGGPKAALFRGEHRITQEEDDEIPQHAGAGVGALQPRHQQLVYRRSPLIIPAETAKEVDHIVFRTAQCLRFLP